MTMEKSRNVPKLGFKFDVLTNRWTTDPGRCFSKE